jgi:hypothetical protein
MTNKWLILIVPIIALSCSTDKKPHLESFIWIENNRNWIRDSNNLQAIEAIFYKDSARIATLAQSSQKRGLYDYYIIHVPDSLHNLLYDNLYGKEYNEYYRHDWSKGPSLYDGNIYCLIYKFSNQSERIINYITDELPSDLLPLVLSIENLAKTTHRHSGSSFPLKQVVNRYRNSMYKYFEPLPFELDTIPSKTFDN